MFYTPIPLSFHYHFTFSFTTALTQSGSQVGIVAGVYKISAISIWGSGGCISSRNV